MKNRFRFFYFLNSWKKRTQNQKTNKQTNTQPNQHTIDSMNNSTTEKKVIFLFQFKAYKKLLNTAKLKKNPI